MLLQKVVMTGLLKFKLRNVTRVSVIDETTGIAGIAETKERTEITGTLLF